MIAPIIEIIDAGLQTTVQAGPRIGLRHVGVPASGAADPLSLALANRLVENAPDAPALEVTLTGLTLRALAPVRLGVTGAPCTVSFPDSGDSLPPAEGQHRTLFVGAGETVTLGPAIAGCRSYVAIGGGISATPVFGSASTYLPARLGGIEGRALRGGDGLHRARDCTISVPHRTPERLCPPFGRGWTLRAVKGPEADWLSASDLASLFGEGWRASRAADRVGIRLDGTALCHAQLPGKRDQMDSVPTLPGTVQVPGGGAPIVLGVDGGTTGGYPRVAQIIRADRHLIGQLRPGDPVRLLLWEAEDADAVLAEKTALLRAWVGDAFRL